MGMTRGLLAAMVAHTAPPELRGTAFGMFNLMSGTALLLASTGAGVLWGNLRRRLDVLRRGDNLRGHAHRHARDAVGLSSGLKRLRGQTSCFTVTVKAPERAIYFCP